MADIIDVASAPENKMIDFKSKGVDFKRSAKVGLLGVVLNGFALGAWYRILDRYLGADRSNIKAVFKKCAADQMVYAPFSIATFVGYAAVLSEGDLRTMARETGRNLQENFVSIWLTDWKVWPAANLVMFRLIPSSYRPSFASVVSVAWQTYMSSVSYNSPQHSTAVTRSEGEPMSVRGGAGKDRRRDLLGVKSQTGVHTIQHQRVTMKDRQPTGRCSMETTRGCIRGDEQTSPKATSLEGEERAPQSNSKKL